MDAAVVAQLLALGVQLHTCRLVRGDVLRHVPLEDEGADVTCAQVTVEPGELPPALSGKVDGNGVTRHDVAMNGIKHKGDLPQILRHALAHGRGTHDFRRHSGFAAQIVDFRPVSGPLSYRVEAVQLELLQPVSLNLLCARPSSFPGSLWVATSRVL